ncbi:MAG: DUF2313 domain-containing protein [Desulfobulbaceae bacterium]|nr:DUF2313 domain-containing protein [Desulfobulbaceae bacterium]
MAMTAADYLSMLQALLPTGAAWPRVLTSELSALLGGISEELARIDERAEDLLNEADPRTALELLEDWERVAGLPDSCSGDIDTMQERHEALEQRLTELGGQSRAYFIAVAERLGYVITIEEFEPFICNDSECGDELCGDDTVRSWWQVTVADAKIIDFVCGESECGDALGDIDRADTLECICNQLKPAHTQLIFNYEGA